jgi:3-hydroxy-3-methylglutaryl CoA synthase
MRVGIDDLNVYGSTLSLDALVLAEARGVAAKTIEALELVRRSLPPPFEDPVTLAVNAARPLIDAAEEPYTLLIVATESGIDFAKPLSSYVHHHLALPSGCRHIEVKHACYGATAALRLASSWVQSHPRAHALVIATDMARRLFGDPAEPAEGAGAVAMSVAANPRVLTLDPEGGVSAREIYDVMRPNPVLETIHSELSLAAYLDLLEDAWEAYAAIAGEAAAESFEHVVYHTPLTPLVKQAHATWLSATGRDGEPARESFDRMVRPSLRFCRELGNLYSGCLYAALAGLVDAREVDAPARIGLFSYGSGSCAEFFSGTIERAAHSTLARHRIAEHLAQRRAVSFEAYERLVLSSEESLTAAHFLPDRELVAGLFDEAYAGRKRLVLERVKDYYRAYAWS